LARDGIYLAVRADLVTHDPLLDALLVEVMLTDHFAHYVSHREVADADRARELVKFF